MGRGRNVPVDQTKPKIRMDKERGEYYRWWRFHRPKEGKDTNSVFLADNVVNDIKRMNPQQLVEFFFIASVTMFCHSLVTKLFSAEASSIFRQPPLETSLESRKMTGFCQGVTNRSKSIIGKLIDKSMKSILPDNNRLISLKNRTKSIITKY